MTRGVGSTRTVGAGEGLVELRLWTSGSWVLATGMKPGEDDSAYLAVGRGSTWEQIAVELPDRPEDVPTLPVGAARTPGGELWIGVGDPWVSDGMAPAVWRKPPGEAWRPVPYPAVRSRALRGATWVRNDPDSGGGWAQAERPPLRIPPAQVRGLVWAAGGIWISLDVGEAYPGSDVYTTFPRTLLLTTVPGEAKAVSLPSSLAIGLERHNARAKSMTLGQEACGFGQEACGLPSLLLGPPPPDEAQQVAIAETLQALDDGDADLGAAVEQVYVGRLGGATVLVAAVRLHGEDPKPLLEAVAKATERTGTLDCRVPRLVRMIADG